MTRKFTILAIAVAVVFGAFTLVLPKLSAQTNEVTLSISPPIFELSVNPGEQIKNSIKVTNLSDSAQEVFVDRRNFTALGEEGGVGLTEEETSYSLASWIHVGRERSVIDRKKSEVFEFVIDVPANAEPGGHFGSLIFKIQAKKLKDGQAGTAVGQEVGALLLVKIAGDIKEKAEIASFKTNKGFYENGPISFTTRTKNTGNVHLKPRGTITVHNMFGSEVATFPIDERNVLPDAIRSVETDWNTSGFKLGRYTANLNMVYGDEGTITTSSTSFFFFPYKIILLVLGAAGALVFAGYRYRARFKAAFKALSGR